jgi:hypothetical protein
MRVFFIFRKKNKNHCQIFFSKNKIILILSYLGKVGVIVFKNIDLIGVKNTSILYFFYKKYKQSFCTNKFGSRVIKKFGKLFCTRYGNNKFYIKDIKIYYRYSKMLHVCSG